MWRRLRWLFRWCRIGVLFSLFVALVAVVFLHTIGLPDWLKNQLLAELAARGVYLSTERMAVRWYHGVVAEQVAWAPNSDPKAPRLQIGELAIKLNTRALLNGVLQVDSLGLRDARISLDLSEAGQPPQPLVLDHINTDLRFLQNDVWEVDEFEAALLGVKIHLLGTIAHASSLRTRPRAAAAASEPAVWRAQVRQWTQVAEKLKFLSPPDLRLRFRGDARNPSGFTAELLVRAKGAQTPWGSLKNFQINGSLNPPPSTPGSFNTALQLVADDARTRWGEFKEVRLTLWSVEPATNPIPTHLDWKLLARQVRTPHARLETARLMGQSKRLDTQLWRTSLSVVTEEVVTDWAHSRSNRFFGWFIHSLTNASPNEAAGTLELGGIDSKWCRADSLALTARLEAAPPTAGAILPQWGWWEELAPFRISWSGSVANLQSRQVQCEALSLAGSWVPPLLSIESLSAALYGGQINLSTGRLDVASRDLKVDVRSSVDPHRLAALCPSNVQEALRELEWGAAPRIAARASLTFAQWTNAPARLSELSLATLVLDAEASFTNASYRKAFVSSAQAGLAYSNSVWTLGNLTISRPEGTAELKGEFDARASKFHAELRSSVDPAALLSAIPSAQGALDDLRFTQAPILEAEAWGDARRLDQLGVIGRVSVTNFVFRGDTADRAWSDFSYTNRFLSFLHPELWHGSEYARAEGLGLSLTNWWLYFTNAQSRIDPMRVVVPIGPDTAKAIRPYHFISPPMAHVNGHVPVKGKTYPVDMRFDVEGGPLEYWRFHIPDVRATVLWQDDSVTVTNLHAQFYTGTLALDLHADLRPRLGATIQFNARANELQLHQLLADLSPRTNRLEGIASINLNVTSFNTEDWDSWNGYGNVQMHDGLLWDLPIFGIFSPVLNAVAPGLGNNRANGAKASYTILQSVIRTDDLEIRATPVRLAYSGTVDFQGRVNARVEAEILRGAPVLGPLLRVALSPLTKLFEYRVTGTLDAPKTAPLYIPKFVDSLLHPLRTLKKLLPSEPEPAKP